MASAKSKAPDAPEPAAETQDTLPIASAKAPAGKRFRVTAECGAIKADSGLYEAGQEVPSELADLLPGSVEAF